MTELLEKVLDRVSKLPADEQDVIAAVIYDVLEDEIQWQDAFATSQDKLSILADKVRKDIQAGRVKKMGIDEL